MGSRIIDHLGTHKVPDQRRRATRALNIRSVYVVLVLVLVVVVIEINFYSINAMVMVSSASLYGG
jgi:hypothetical protein